jgi:hypothetical protein
VDHRRPLHGEQLWEISTMQFKSTTDAPRVPACICDCQAHPDCHFIAPLKDFTIDAIAYVYSKAKGKPPAGLRCPRCHCGDRSVTEGEMYRPAPDPHHHLKPAILALDIDPALKDAPVSTPMRACNLSTPRLH